MSVTLSRPELTAQAAAHLSIDVRGLTKRYGDLVAVDGIDFSVGQGEIFAFLGPNGAGKSTTIKMLCTLAHPTSGHATVAGFDVTSMAKSVRRHIGLVFQEQTLDDQLTAEENLRFHAVLYGVPHRQVESRISRVMELVALSDRRRDLVSTYSGGMARRLEIARGMLHTPKILFLDEPTVGLDPQTRALIWEDIERLRTEEGVTIFLTTHYMDEAEYAERIAIIDHGAIIALDTPDVLKASVGTDTVAIETSDDDAALVSLIAAGYEVERTEVGLTAFVADEEAGGGAVVGAGGGAGGGAPSRPARRRVPALHRARDPRAARRAHPHDGPRPWCPEGLRRLDDHAVLRWLGDHWRTASRSSGPRSRHEGLRRGSRRWHGVGTRTDPLRPDPNPDHQRADPASALPVRARLRNERPRWHDGRIQLPPVRLPRSRGHERRHDGDVLGPLDRVGQGVRLSARDAGRAGESHLSRVGQDGRRRHPGRRPGDDHVGAGAAGGHPPDTAARCADDRTGAPDGGGHDHLRGVRGQPDPEDGVLPGRHADAADADVVPVGGALSPQRSSWMADRDHPPQSAHLRGRPLPSGHFRRPRHVAGGSGTLPDECHALRVHAAHRARTCDRRRVRPGVLRPRFSWAVQDRVGVERRSVSAWPEVRVREGVSWRLSNRRASPPERVRTAMSPSWAGLVQASYSAPVGRIAPVLSVTNKSQTSRSHPASRMESPMAQRLRARRDGGLRAAPRTPRSTSPCQDSGLGPDHWTEVRTKRPIETSLARSEFRKEREFLGFGLVLGRKSHDGRRYAQCSGVAAHRRRSRWFGCIARRPSVG